MASFLVCHSCSELLLFSQLGTEGIAAEQKKRQDELDAIRKADPRTLGMGAATVHRDARGRPLAMLNQMLAGRN